jgi:hypothetical protein
MKQLGWVWTPTMQIGSGCTVHLRPSELPSGRLVVSVSKHLTAMIDGVIHDTHDCSRRGKRCVYGYWQPPSTGKLPFAPIRLESQVPRRSSPPKPRPVVTRRKPEPKLPQRRTFLEWLFG